MLPKLINSGGTTKQRSSFTPSGAISFQNLGHHRLAPSRRSKQIHSMQRVKLTSRDRALSYRPCSSKTGWEKTRWEEAGILA